MKTRTKGLLIVLMVAICSVFCLTATACNQVENAIPYTAINDEQHKQDGVVSDHEYTENVVTALSCTVDGVIEYTCAKCGFTKTVTTPALGHFEAQYSYDNNAHWYAKRADCACEVTESKQPHDKKMTVDAAAGTTTYSCECGWSSSEEGIYNKAELNVGSVDSPALNTYYVPTPTSEVMYYVQTEYYTYSLYKNDEGLYEIYGDDEVQILEESELVEGVHYDFTGNELLNEGVIEFTFTASKAGEYTFAVESDSYAEVDIDDYVNYNFFCTLCPTDAISDGSTVKLVLDAGQVVNVAVGIADPSTETGVSYDGKYYAVELEASCRELPPVGAAEETAAKLEAHYAESNYIYLPAGESYYFALTNVNPVHVYSQVCFGAYHEDEEMKTYGELELSINGAVVDLSNGLSDPIRLGSGEVAYVKVSNVGNYRAGFFVEAHTWNNPAYELKAGENTLSIPAADLMDGITVSYNGKAGDIFSFTLDDTAKNNQAYLSYYTYMEYFVCGYQEDSFTATSKEFNDSRSLDLKTVATELNGNIEIKITLNLTPAGSSEKVYAPIYTTVRGQSGYVFADYKDTITLAAGASYYAKVTNNTEAFNEQVKLSVDNPAIALTIDSVEVDLFTGSYLYQIGEGGMYVFKNMSKLQVEFTLKIENYQDNKADLRIGENVIRLEDDQLEGYEITYVAKEEGTYTFANTGIDLVYNGLYICAGSAFKVDLNANAEIKFTVYAPEAGGYDFEIDFEAAIPRGDKTNLIAGENDIELTQGEQCTSEFIAPVAGEYTFSCPVGADCFIIFGDYDKCISVDDGMTVNYTLEKDQKLAIVFASYSFNATTYVLTITAPVVKGNNDNIIVGENILTVAEGNDESTFIAPKAGKYTFTFTGDQPWANVAISMFESTNITEVGGSVTYDLTEGQSVTIAYENYASGKPYNGILTITVA